MTGIVRASLGLPTLRAGPQFQNSKRSYYLRRENYLYVLVIEYWNLRFVCDLVLEIWDLSFGLPPFGRVPSFGIRISKHAEGRDSFVWERLSSRDLAVSKI